MTRLAVGQVWRERDDKDYGHIIRWEVVAIRPAFATVRNMATLKEVEVANLGPADTFRHQCTLMQGETGWN